MSGLKKLFRRLIEAILVPIGVRLLSLERAIAQRSLPAFANKPRNFRMDLPRTIDNPQNMRIGENVAIGPGSMLKTVRRFPGNVEMVRKFDLTVDQFEPELIIGDRVSATAGLQLSAIKRIVIEDDVMFASNVFVCDGLHGYGNTDMPYKYQRLCRIEPITIGKGSWIGQNVVILPGVTIGEMAIIGANSVVNRNVPARSIAVGSPARVIKTWDLDNNTWIGVR